MTTHVVRACGIAGVSLFILSATLVGCGKEQAPPPAQTPPPAGVAQTAPAAVPPAPGANQLQIGMTTEQVQQIMGAPGKIKQEKSELEWEYYTPQGEVEVKFINNLVTAIERK